MSREPSKAVFITFYSFKGGVGRSMALINTAGILAGRRGFRVLVLDLDLEAPGLSYLDPELPDVSPAQAQRQLPLQPGFVDLISDAKERGEGADLFTLSAEDLESKYTQRIKIPEDLRDFPDGSLRIMPAGLFDRNYAQRLDALNLGALYREGLGEPLLRAFKKKFAEAGLYDYVLVDSRTGMSEGGGICTRDLADHLMLLSGLNRQNVEGTCEFLREFRAATDGKKKFQIILSPMPNGEDKLCDDRREAAANAFQAAWGAAVDLSLEIPYHPQLALTEEPHIFRRHRGYLFEAYRAIEAEMLTALGHDARTFRQLIMESLEGKDYATALRDLRHLIRLDRGKGALSTLADELVVPRQLRRRAEAKPGQEPITLESLLKDQGGRNVMEFIVDRVPVGGREWLTRRLVQKLRRRSPELAGMLLQRIIEGARGDADRLGGYALALEGDGYFEGAEMAYKRAIETDPNHPKNLWNYGDFLEEQRKDIKTAEEYYKRAIEADPQDARRLGSYALFLSQRGDMDAADSYYRRAIEVEPKHPAGLGNYGQMLAGQGRMTEAREKLVAAFGSPDQSERAETAELCFALWLVCRMQNSDAEGWERCFKFLIQQGFKRSPWSFDRMLEQAQTKCSADEFEYAKALAAAFLDESKVPDLERLERWRKLEPLDPKSQRQALSAGP